MEKNDLLALILIGILLFVIFLPIYGPLAYRFTTHDTYYSHGFLIPFVVAFLIWRKRKSLSQIKPKPCLWGIGLGLFGLILHLAGVVLKVNFASYLAVPLILMGIILYLGGKEFARQLFFPIGFLIFMLPLPKVAIIGIAFKLKMLTTHVSIFAVNLIGIQASSSGATIEFPGGFLIMGDPCSGLRSLITFLALGALFTQFTNAARWKKPTIFAATIPIALFSNFLRIVFLIIVGFLWGQDIATGIIHDISGFMVFIVGFIGFIAVTRILKCQLSA